jgi:hypothetical protein
VVLNLQGGDNGGGVERIHCSQNVDKIVKTAEKAQKTDSIGVTIEVRRIHMLSSKTVARMHNKQRSISAELLPWAIGDSKRVETHRHPGLTT